MQETLTFVTLFLALVTGPHPVEVAVTGDVARVEFLLGETQVAECSRAPWRSMVDFGPELHPHRLTAIAFDSDDREIARGGLLLNVPRPAAEARLHFERDRRGRPTAVKVFWEHSGGARAVDVQVLEDGRPLRAGKGGAWPLSRRGDHRAHVVQVDVLLDNDEIVSSATAYGSGSQDGALVQVSAVPVISDRKPSMKNLETALRTPEGRARVVAVEERPVSLHLIHDVRAAEGLAKRLGIHGAMKASEYGVTEVEYRASGPEVRPGDVVVHHSAVPSEVPGVRRFQRSGPLSLVERPLRWRLFDPLERDIDLGHEQRILEAAAVAGVEAAGSFRPRAVVILAGPTSTGHSGAQTAALGTFLQELRVPHVVWTTGLDRPETAWGVHARNISSMAVLKDEARKLVERTHDQWIVWIEGNWLPNEVTLEEGDAKLRLAGVD